MAEPTPQIGPFGSPPGQPPSLAPTATVGPATTGAASGERSGRWLARYRIDEEVGRGGMAVVYRGLDGELGREVAVKVLHAHLAGQAESRARLQREAQAVAKLHHDNILEIYDYSGADAAESYLVTEFIHGVTLTAFLAHHQVPFPEVAEMIASEVVRALEHAHGFGVLHRDIKPENVMIRTDGRVKLTDFGIAQIIDKERLTATGQLIGSPAYMSPELVTGGPIDFRTDVFSAGILLYQLACKALPFPGRNPHEVMKKIADGKFVPPGQANPLVGTQLSRILGRALARDPADRYPDMASLRADLLADLALAGFTDPRRELGAFFAAPEPWAQAARPRIVAALVQSGRREMAAKRAAAAVALAGRALALAPDDAGARDLVDGVARRRRLGRIGAALLGTAGLLGGVGLLIAHPPRWLRPRAAPSPTPVATSADPASATAAPVTAGSSPPLGPGRVGATTNVIPVAARPRERPSGVRSGAPPGSIARLVELNVIPKNVQVFVDGRPIGSWVPGTPISVGPGEHRLRFQNDSCFEKEVTLGANERRIELVRLGWKSAALVVHATPETAKILVEPKHGPRATPEPGQAQVVRIPAESPDGREEVHVTVVAAGYAKEEFDLPLRANQRLERAVALRPAR